MKKERLGQATRACQELEFCWSQKGTCDIFTNLVAGGSRMVFCQVHFHCTCEMDAEVLSCCGSCIRGQQRSVSRQLGRPPLAEGTINAPRSPGVLVHDSSCLAATTRSFGAHDVRPNTGTSLRIVHSVFSWGLCSLLCYLSVAMPLPPQTRQDQQDQKVPV